MNKDQETILARIDERLEIMEGTVNKIDRKLFTGNGHSVMTRLGIAENNISTLKKQRGEKGRAKFAIMVTLIAGLISFLTTISVAYIAK
jgi:hypothetical protein